MALSHYLGFDFGPQDYYVIAQLFNQPIDAEAFFSCAVSLVSAVFCHGVLILLTQLFWRI